MHSERKILDFTFITNDEISTHYHQNPELLYVIQGQMHVQLENASFLLKPGDFIMINANKTHTCTGEDNLFGARFMIDYHLLSEYLGSLQIMFLCNTVIDRNDAYHHVRDLLDRILERYFEKERKSALLLSALSFQLLYILTGHFLVKSDDLRINIKNSEDQLRIQQIQNYIQANFQSPISLNDLSNRLHLSNAYLSKYIKKHLGLSFMEYLNNIRLFHAVDEVIHSDKSLTRIALDNGFSTSTAFTHAFQTLYEKTPGEYRKEFQISSDTREDHSPQKKEELFRRYFNNGNVKDLPLPAGTWNIQADALVSQKINSYFGKAINAGNVYALLRSDVQQQLLQLKMECGIRYIRIWNLFIPEYFSQENNKYDFRKLGIVLDFLIENQLKPYIELNFKTNQYILTPEYALDFEAPESSDFSFDTYHAMIIDLCHFLYNRYGHHELTDWYFSFGNDLNIPSEQSDIFFKYFNCIFQTIKEYFPDTKVGGGSFVIGIQTPLLKNFLLQWKSQPEQPDFLTFRSYQYVSFEDNGTLYGRKSIDGHYMEHQFEIIKYIMNAIDYHPAEIQIDEWNFTVSNKNYFNDSCSQGAYILKSWINMLGRVDQMIYWHGLDVETDFHISDELLCGDSGLLSKDGIRKSSYWAFWFIQKLNSYLIFKDDYCIITTDCRNHYSIACHNFKVLSSDYVFIDEDKISPDLLEEYIENTDSMCIHMQLNNVKNGTYQVKSYFLNNDNGCALGLWKSLNYCKTLSRDDIQYLSNHASPHMEIHDIHVTDGVLNLSPVLQAQEIRFLDVHYIV